MKKSPVIKPSINKFSQIGSPLSAPSTHSVSQLRLKKGKTLHKIRKKNLKDKTKYILMGKR